MLYTSEIWNSMSDKCLSLKQTSLSPLKGDHSCNFECFGALQLSISDHVYTYSQLHMCSSNSKSLNNNI